MRLNDRRENARRAAIARWSRVRPEDRAAELIEARRGFLRGFADKADPRHELPVPERQRLAKALRRDYMKQLARKRHSNLPDDRR